MSRALRAVLVVARHEVRRVAGAFRRPSTLAAFTVVVALMAALGPTLLERGVQPDRGLYPVHVEEGSPFLDAVLSDLRFERVPHDLGRGAVLRLGADGSVRSEASDAGLAALRELREAVRQWQEGELANEPDAGAAFPVEVNLLLAVPDAARAAGPPGGGSTTTAAPGPGQGTGTDAPDPVQQSVLERERGGAAVVQAAIRPNEVEPPFPVRSLLLTFAFLIPMNFVAQLYSGTLLADRVRHRALLAITSPHAPRTILLGRSLPYLVAGALVLAAAGTLTGAGWQGWLAAIPVVAFVLAAALALGLLARSERELTFLLTGATTMLSVFLFLPAIFTAIPAVAFLSPVSVLVASMQGETVGAGLFLYATLPLVLCTVALTLVGSALYREETLFSPRRLRDKVLAALAVRSRTPLHTVLAGVLAVPFAFVLELLVLSLAIPLGLEAALPVTLVGVVLVEERLKLAVAAARRRRVGGAPWKAGALAGAGFFLGEKIALILAWIGFAALPLGVPTLRVFGVAGGWLLLAAPLVLHMACSALAASGLGRGPWVARATFLAAAAVHLAYNFAVIWAGGF